MYLQGFQFGLHPTLANIVATGATGTVQYWTSAESTTSPNATVPVASLTPSNSATNVDAALLPKGNGAILRQIPDGTATSGNKRGQYAVDFQGVRNTAAQVASGNYSLAFGYGNTASGLFSGSGGNVCIASGQASFAFGDTCLASGSGSVAFGGQNNATNTSATVSGGFQNTASGNSSWIPGGSQATTRGLQGARAYSSGARASVGDRQIIGQPVCRTTTDTTTTTLTADGAAAAFYNVLVLPNNSSLTGLVSISARDSSGNCASWLLFCRVSRGANAASTAVDFQTTVASNLSGALSTATAVIAADTTQGALIVSVAGVAATTIDWIADPSCLQLVR